MHSPWSDGVRLRYTLVRPSAQGRFPVAINYGPYFNGSDPLEWSANSAKFVGAGYAVLGVNLRGTGCSTGVFGLLDQPESLDAVRVIEWAGTQKWSTGHTGMFGLSYPGMVQYGAAGLHAPHLDAIAPFQTINDLYRDVAFPGGMLNVRVSARCGVSGCSRRAERGEGVAKAARQGDLESAQNHTIGQSNGAYTDLAPKVLLDPWPGPVLEAHSPGRFLNDIDIPVLGCVSWQDDMVSSGSLSSFAVLDPETSWVIGTNGYHGVCDARNTWPYLRGSSTTSSKATTTGSSRRPT